MFKEIKEGDFIIAHTWIMGICPIHKYALCKVTKVNKKTFAVDKYPYKTFMISNGLVYGGKGWERIQLMKYDAEFYAKKIAEQEENDKRKDLLAKIGGINYKQLTTEQLERIVEVVEGNEVE